MGLRVALFVTPLWNSLCEFHTWHITVVVGIHRLDLVYESGTNSDLSSKSIFISLVRHKIRGCCNVARESF